MDLTFRVTPGKSDLTRETIEVLENEIMRLVAERLGTAAKSWLEAGGYVKWSKGSASQLRVDPGQPIRELTDLGELQRIIKG